MSMSEWAKKEIEIACKHERGDKPETEWDYGCACYKSAYKSFLSLLEDGHSGMSIGFTQNILNRLIDGKPLTPIEDVPDVWNEVEYRPVEKRSYQCKRMSSLFKDVYEDGRVVYHDVDRIVCHDKDRPDSPGWRSGFIAQRIDRRFPVTMPYYPAAKPYSVFCGEGLTDPKNGDFDTIGIFYVIKPNGEREDIMEFFKETEDEVGWSEISEEEYMQRVGGANNG